MVVKASLGMVDPILLAQIPYMGVDKCCAIKRENVLGNFQTYKRCYSNEGSHSNFTSSLEDYYLEPLGITFYSSDDPYMILVLD